MPQNDRTPPTLDISAVPLSEREFARKCETNLRSMSLYVMQFDSALRLFLYMFSYYSIPQTSLFVRSNDPGNWKLIAARDGAMCIYHFAKSFDGVCYWTSQSAFLSSRINRAERKQASEILRERFPQFETMRNAIAHAGDIFGNAQSEKHIIKGPLSTPDITVEEGGKLFVQDSFSGDRTFMTTFRGELQQYDIDHASLEALRNACIHCYASFAAIRVGR
jgi:hypothetical protein